LEA
jgi:hypothetical protein